MGRSEEPGTPRAAVMARSYRAPGAGAPGQRCLSSVPGSSARPMQVSSLGWTAGSAVPHPATRSSRWGHRGLCHGWGSGRRPGDAPRHPLSPRVGRGTDRVQGHAALVTPHEHRHPELVPLFCCSSSDSLTSVREGLTVFKSIYFHFYEQLLSPR